MAERYLGCFVSCAGGLFNALNNGEALGVNTIMIHPTPPQRWNAKPFEQEDIDKFNERRKSSNIQQIYMHGIYLINLANPDSQKFHLAKISLVNYLELEAKIGANGVMFHTGSIKDTTEKEGLDRVVYGLNWIFDELEKKEVQLKKNALMLEVAAGAGKVVGDRFDELARIFEMVNKNHQDKLAFCLDTQHMFASGYDIVNELDSVVDEIDKTLGIENINCVHFNDSKTELGSNRDRHENIGDGLIGETAMKAFLNHPKLKHLPFVMETPALKDPETAKDEVGKLLSWAE